MPKISPVLNFWLSLAAFVAQGIAAGTVNLVGMIPGEWVHSVDEWMGFAVFVWMGFQTLLNGAAGPGVGPLAKPLSINEASKLLDQAHIDAVGSVLGTPPPGPPR